MMFIFRLILLLFVITAMVLFGLYLLSADKKYLFYFKQTLKYLLFMVVAFFVITIVRRLLIL
jgi:hypothetical protein